jgi:endoglycosylceramidase
VTTALSQTICATGEDAPVDGAKVGILSRAYPRTAPGDLTSLTADGPELEMAGTTESRSCDLEVWIPGAREPELTSTGVTDLESTAVEGGWSVTGCVDGDYTLSSN